MKNLHKKEFDSFLKEVFEKSGIEGIVNSIPFTGKGYVVTVDGEIVAANDEFMELIGYTRDELYGRKAVSITHQGDRNSVQRHINEKLTDRYYIRLITKDFKIKYVAVLPRYTEIHGVSYRFSEFIDTTPLVELQRKQITTLKKMAVALANTIEKRDPYTYGHMSRTAIIAIEISRYFSLGQDTIDKIWLGATIHDIGKISVPSEILTKPTKLEQHEWSFIKLHSNIGYRIIEDVDFDNIIKQIVLLHHENQDGSGYPKGLTGDQIPFEVAIVSVADSLEAIAGVRPYRKALSFEDAIDVMKEYPGKYHPEILDAAVKLVKDGTISETEFGLH